MRSTWSWNALRLRSSSLLFRILFWDSMSNIKHENLLIFEAWAARLFVSATDDGDGEYIVRLRPLRVLQRNI